MKKIAVVEDDEYIGNMLCELLREKAVRSLFYGRKRPRVHGARAFHRQTFRRTDGREHRRFLVGGAAFCPHEIMSFYAGICTERAFFGAKLSNISCNFSIVMV